MSQPNRKRQHQQSPPVKQEQQHEEESTHSFGAEINANQCSSSNWANSNTNGTAAGENGNDDIQELKLKMAMLEARNQILEGKLENQELRARLHAMSEENILANLKQENRALWMRLNEVEANGQAENKKIMDELKRLTALEAKHQQEILGLKAINESKQQQQRPTAKMSVCVVNMPESQGTSNNTNETQHRIVENRKQAKQPTAAALVSPPPKSVAPNLVSRHSVKLSDCVNMRESHSQENGDNFDEDELLRLRALESRHHRKQAKLALIPPPIRGRQHAIMDAVAALVPPPLKLKSVVVNPVTRHLAQHQEQPQMANKRRLCNLEGNYWNVKNCRATMKVSPADGLTAHNSSPVDWGNVYAKKGFRISQFAAGQMLYYYEITNKSAFVSEESQLYIGLILSDAMLPKDSWIGWTPNTYAMPEKCDYCLISGKRHQFEEPNGTIVPKWNGHGDIVGCGLLFSADHKLSIFFTNNGILLGKQMPIMPLGSNVLTPTVCMNKNVTLEANFGAKPFKYNIDQCPGMLFE